MNRLPSRDHRERLPTRLGRFEDSHGITLPVNDIPNRSRHILSLPQPPRTPMPGPPLTSRFVQPPAIQTPAGEGLEVVHDSLRASLRFHYDVNMVGAHVRSQQVPVALRAALPQGSQHCIPAAFVHAIGRLIHELPLGGSPLRIGGDHPAPVQIMPSIHGTAFVAMYEAAVTSECDQVGQLTAPCGRGSV